MTGKRGARGKYAPRAATPRYGERARIVEPRRARGAALSYVARAAFGCSAPRRRVRPGATVVALSAEPPRNRRRLADAPCPREVAETFHRNVGSGVWKEPWPRPRHKREQAARVARAERSVASCEGQLTRVLGARIPGVEVASEIREQVVGV